MSEALIEALDNDLTHCRGHARQGPLHHGWPLRGDGLHVGGVGVYFFPRLLDNVMFWVRSDAIAGRLFAAREEERHRVDVEGDEFVWSVTVPVVEFVAPNGRSVRVTGEGKRGGYRLLTVRYQPRSGRAILEEDLEAKILGNLGRLALAATRLGWWFVDRRRQGFLFCQIRPRIPDAVQRRTFGVPPGTPVDTTAPDAAARVPTN